MAKIAKQEPKLSPGKDNHLTQLSTKINGPVDILFHHQFYVARGFDLSFTTLPWVIVDLQTLKCLLLDECKMAYFVI
jgi:hypothetical protein